MPLSRPTQTDLATTTSPPGYSSPLRKWRVTLDTGELMNHEEWPSRTRRPKVHSYFSDISIQLKKGSPIPAHKFVLAARSDAWADLRSGSVVDWADFPISIGRAILAWIYSDRIQG